MSRFAEALEWLRHKDIEMNLPAHNECFTSRPRDLAINDRSRFRNGTATEGVVMVNLGNGMTQVSYVDVPTVPEAPQG